MGSHQKPFERAQFDLILDQGGTTTDAIRCLSDLIHFNAIHNPRHVFCVQSRQSTACDKEVESVKLTFHELAHAVEQCCRWILSQVSGSHPAKINRDGSIQKSQPVALFLESDLTLFVYLGALLTLNIPCLLLSIKLNSEAVEHLLKETRSSSIIVSSRTRLSIKGALERPDQSNAGLRMITAASAEEFLCGPVTSPSDSYLSIDHQNVVREDDRNVLVLHSSGTTGLPKPISLAHRYLLGYAACHEFPPTEDLSTHGYNLSTLPLYHGFGTLAPCLSLSVGKPVWFAPSSTIPNGSLVISLLQAAKGEITSLMTVPTILEDITLQTNFLSHAAGELAKLDFVVVGGGGIKDAVGSKLASNGVTLLNHFGATELGALAPIFQPEDGHDWRYLRIRTDLGLRLESVESQGSDSDVSRCKLIGHPFAWEEEFELQDDLAANPEKPDSEVKILGRNDDVIILATGENVLPHPLERTLEQHCLVKRAIVFGHGQFELGLLIESLPTFGGPPEELVDEIWSTVEEANKLMDNHARISSKGAILVKPAEKDIPLTDKQSMKRKTVYKEFGQEISAVYTRLAADDISTSSVPIDLENLEESLRIIAQSCLPIYNNSEPWNDNSDFIALGMDSLQATRFRRILQASIQRSGASIPLLADLPLDIIYSNPSVNTLAKALKSWFHGSDSDLDPTKDMTNLIEKYAYAQRDSSVRGDKNIVLVTGSTGNLGANLLQGLSENQSIDGIICLIRSRSNEDASQESLVTRQRKALEDRGIILSESAWSKINLLSWFPGADKLGLSEDNFRSLSLCVTHIFHGAWPMDFKVKVRSLEPQVKAMRDLIELARLAHVSKPSVRPRVVLASSIAVVGRYHSDLQPSIVPETPMDDARSPLPIGYAEAKWVCEKVMESAYYHLKDVEPIIVRIGQLSGSNKTGFWSPKEHFPALVRASQEIGALPDMQGSLSWIPVDSAAQITMDILLGSGPRELVYHLENPIRQPWPDMCAIIEQSISFPSVGRLPFSAWLDKVSSAKNNSQDLIEFFQDHFLHMATGNLILDTAKAREVSDTLKSTGTVDQSAVTAYLGFWKRIDFLA